MRLELLLRCYLGQAAWVAVTWRCVASHQTVGCRERQLDAEAALPFLRPPQADIHAFGASKSLSDGIFGNSARYVTFTSAAERCPVQFFALANGRPFSNSAWCLAQPSCPRAQTMATFTRGSPFSKTGR